MKLNFLHKKIMIIVLTGVCSTIISNTSMAQKSTAQLLRAGANDGSKLVEAYIGPLFKGFGASLNNGWFNTAKPHGTAMFDITFAFNLTVIPQSDRTFDASTLGFEKLRIKSGTGPETPTYAGKRNPSNLPVYEIYENNPITNTEELVTSFTSPKGGGFPFSGAPTIQAAVGIYKKTELMIRYMPTVKIKISGQDRANMNLFGFGVKHDVKQWIPVISALPFDLSAYFGYTQFRTDSKLALNAESGVPNKTGNTATYDNQELNAKTTATTFGAIVSKKLAMLTVYGSVGYGMSKTELDLKGNYPITTIETDPTNTTQFGQKVVDKLTDPVNIDIKGANGLKATAGFRLKMAIITLHADYTLAKYPVASIGLGLNLDWK